MLNEICPTQRLILQDFIYDILEHAERELKTDL